MSLALNPSSAKATKNGGRAEARRQESSHMLDIISKPREGMTVVPPRRSREENAKLETERVRSWVQAQIAKAKQNGEPISELVTLTPSLAFVLLEINQANRPLSQVNIERMSRDITAGRWELNGEPLIVSDDGNLNDGQHRCWAVIEANKSVRTFIVFGPQRDTRFTLDQGVSRTVAHFLGMNGHDDANTLAAVATHIWQWKQKKRLSTAGTERPTKAEALLIVDHYTDIPDSLAFVSRKGVGAVAKRSLLAFCHYAIATTVTREAADSFIDRLIKGANLKDRDPILYCRNRLIETKTKAATNEKAELIFHAFNADQRGQEVSRINVLGKQLPKLEK